jgi:hypothetical protein
MMSERHEKGIPVTADDSNLDASQARTLAAEREARYPDLLSGPWGMRPPVWRRQRPASGFCATILEQSALTTAQWRQLGVFRLHQFILCGWYDARRVETDRVVIDPSLDHLPARTLHVFVGDADGRLLAYTCLQPAGDVTSALEADNDRVLLTAPGRPLFPTERELFGPHVSTSLAGLREIPLAHIWEWACTIRNQAIRTSITPAAMYEAFCAPILLALDPRFNIDVILGNTNLPARKVYRQLGIPGLYAPTYPVQPPEEDGYWMSGVNQQGEFWPSVMALDDVRAHSEVVRRVDSALDAPPTELPVTLRAALASATPPPQRFVSGNDEAYWTSDIGDHSTSNGAVSA